VTTQDGNPANGLLRFNPDVPGIEIVLSLAFVSVETDETGAAVAPQRTAVYAVKRPLAARNKTKPAKRAAAM
jgi:hypothetical protein